MSDEGFLRRWSRRKAESLRGDAAPPEPAPVLPDAAVVETRADPAVMPDATATPRVLPTLDDVARLTPDADFSAFVAKDVDPLVRRGALKKLFADPHFNAMDGLDVYIDDYTKPSPVSEAMLASLAHARSVFLRPDDKKEEEAGAGAPPTPVLEAAPVDLPAGEPEPDLEPGAEPITTTTPENETP